MITPSVASELGWTPASSSEAESAYLEEGGRGGEDASL